MCVHRSGGPYVMMMQVAVLDVSWLKFFTATAVTAVPYSVIAVTVVSCFINIKL